MHYILKIYLGFDDVQVSSMSRLIDHLQRLKNIVLILLLKLKLFANNHNELKAPLIENVNILAIKRITDLPINSRTICQA